MTITLSSQFDWGGQSGVELGLEQVIRITTVALLLLATLGYVRVVRPDHP
jgi:hypothetical protein